ncbi:hypothetical protein IC582_011988 [Cucumis melo]|uniref:Uncharacterized protein LOC103498213 n=1 Tax=Cucumis melo TaxID=3656 RepID=A0A1S3C929_CUCME|nr:protein OXIDATIVE STRESS 3 [Cucumis melo]
MEGKEQIIEDFEAMELRELNWVIMESREDEVLEAFSTSTIDSSSMNSMESSASELLEDASSSSLTSNFSSSLSLSPSLSSSDDGPLYELSELMANLPIKRGLSKFYNGKSQSFTSLASVKSLEDLAKRVNYNNNNYYNSQRKKMKCCKSYGGSLDAQKSSNYHSPKPLIAKKVSKPSSLLSSVCSKRNNRSF